MTQDDQDEIVRTLRGFVSLLVEHPEGLEVAAHAALDGSVYFALKGDRRDEPILVGHDGSHVRALEAIVRRIGKAAGREFTFRAITAGEPVERAWVRPRDVVTYDATPIIEALSALLLWMPLDEFRIELRPPARAEKSLAFDLTISVGNREDYRELTAPSSGEDQPLVCHLGALVRAMAKKDGVRLRVVVEHAPCETCPSA